MRGLGFCLAARVLRFFQGLSSYLEAVMREISGKCSLEALPCLDCCRAARPLVFSLPDVSFSGVQELLQQHINFEPKSETHSPIISCMPITPQEDPQTW